MTKVIKLILLCFCLSLTSCSIMAGLAPVKEKITDVNDWLVVPVFYATNRVRNDGAKEIDYIPTKRDRGLAFGVKNVVIPCPANTQITPEIIERMGWHLVHFDKAMPSNEIPKISLPQGYKVRDQEFSAKEMAEAFDKYRKAVGVDEALLFVHGCCITFENSLVRTAKLTAAMQIPVAVYDWVSPIGFTKYLENETYAEQTYDDFYSFLKAVANYIPEDQTILLGHSLGAEFLNNAFVRRYEHKCDGHSPSRYKEIIFSQPDIDARSFVRHNECITSQAIITRIFMVLDDGRLEVSATAHGGFPRVGRPGPFLDKLCNIQGQEIIDMTASHMGHNLPFNFIADMHRHGTIDVDGYSSKQRQPHLFVLESNK